MVAENTGQELEKQVRQLQEQNQVRAKEITVLEERMNTKQQEYKTDIARLAGETGSALERMNATFERLRTDMAKRDAERDADMAKRDADMVKRDAERDAESHRRDKDNLRWQIGLWVAAIVILGFVIRFSSAPAVTS